jgi:hypothetical protein
MSYNNSIYTESENESMLDRIRLKYNDHSDSKKRVTFENDHK